MALGGVGPGPAGRLPSLWVCGEPHEALWPGACLQLGLPGWRKARGAGLRVVKSGPQPPGRGHVHTVQSHGPNIWAWPRQLPRADDHDPKAREKHQERAFSAAASLHSQDTSVVKLRARAAQGSGNGSGGAGVSWPALGIRGVERAQRNLGS